VTAAAQDQLLVVPIGKVIPAKDNPRRKVGDVDELAASIRAVGLLEPLVVTNGGDTYALVAGARRLAGAKKAGLAEVPVIVRELTEEQRQEAMLIENLQREELSPLEEAAAFKRLLDLDGYTQRKLAERIGRSQSHISKRLALLDLPTNVQKNVDSGGINLEDAHKLAALKDAPDRMKRALSDARWYGLAQSVKRELAALEKDRKISAKLAELRETGVRVIEWPKNRYEPPKGTVVVSTESWRAGVEMQPSRHAKQACHAVSVDSYGEIVYLCTNAAAHNDRRAKETVARDKQAEEKRKFDADLRAAARAREEFVRTWITGKIPKADALKLILAGMIDLASHLECCHACRLLGLEAQKAQGAVLYEDALAAHAAKGDQQLIQVGLALMCSSPEETLSAAYMSWGGRETREYFARLEQNGYKPSPAEKRKLAGKAP
jgi:ParB/RepB/Spo0J family partition protein